MFVFYLGEYIYILYTGFSNPHLVSHDFTEA